MEFAVKLLVVLAPPFVWLIYFREQEQFSTPAGAVWLSILSGALLTYPAWLLQDYLRTSPDISFRWFHELAVVKRLTLDGVFVRAAEQGIIYGAVEESLKISGVVMVFRLSHRFLQPWHLPVIGLAFGCGFTLVENALLYFSTPNWQHAALLRSLSGVHVFYGAIMGSFLALGFMRRYLVVTFTAALLVPMLLHGAYNHSLAMNAAGGEVGMLARVVFVSVVVLSGVLAIGLPRFVLHLTKRKRENLMMPDQLVHPWVARRRMRKWAWLLLAVFCALMAFAFPLVLGAPLRLTEFREPLVLGILAGFSAIVFALRGGANGESIRSV